MHATRAPSGVIVRGKWCYGPESAAAYGRNAERRDTAASQLRLAQADMSAIYRDLRLQGLPLADRNAHIRQRYPDTWALLVPWAALREQYRTELTEAESADRESVASGDGEWEPCATPYAAWERYAHE